MPREHVWSAAQSLSEMQVALGTRVCDVGLGVSFVGSVTLGVGVADSKFRKLNCRCRVVDSGSSSLEVVGMDVLDSRRELVCVVL